MDTTRWVIGWKDFSATAAPAGSDDRLPHVKLPPLQDKALRALVETLTDLLMRDVSRQWKIADLARAAGLSTRSLQRRLGQGGLSFSALVRLVRIHQACRLLKDRDTPLTAIGFCAGFCDSAHFSRNFRASVGLTPSEYRAVCQGR